MQAALTLLELNWQEAITNGQSNAAAQMAARPEWGLHVEQAGWTQPASHTSVRHLCNAPHNDVTDAQQHYVYDKM